ncbi:hypothetical protein O6H91_04G098900 [Diphasiastrum complanatum]|uniref:Uncharacterized protein n=2 Tax=Diphasiastrum complanatum TaxID=34168 RepID=A0ACC2DZQ8_DIPCM|nr:hypothetical protein O6H91_04G098900 [Diphasiastrum complanatum]
MNKLCNPDCYDKIRQGKARQAGRRKLRSSLRFGGLKKIEMARTSFKDEHSLDERKSESARMRRKYPDRIPVIVERAKGSDLADMEKKKYLVPEDLTVGQFVYIVGKRLHLTAGQALFIFIGKVLPPTASLIGAIYNEYKDQDGFLYVTYSGEKTFG